MSNKMVTIIKLFQEDTEKKIEEALKEREKVKVKAKPKTIKKRKGTITITRNSVGFEGFNEGSGSPCANNEEIEKQLKYLLEYHKENYDLKVVDERKTAYKPQTKWKVGERFLFDNGYSCEYGVIDKIERHRFADGKIDNEDLIEGHFDSKGTYTGFFEDNDNYYKINENHTKQTTINVEIGVDSDGEKDYYVRNEDCGVICHSSHSGNEKLAENFDKYLEKDILWIKKFLLDDGFLDKNITIVRTNGNY